MRGILDNTQAAIFVCDQDACLLRVNKAYERAVGLEASQILGRTVHELYIPEDAQEMLRSVRKVYFEARAETFESAFTIQGEVRWFICSLFPLSDTQGAVTSVCGIVTEVTDRKRYESQLRVAHRALFVLGEANRAVIYAREELPLAQDVCRIIVEEGGYPLAWVGLMGEDEAVLEETAHHGLEGMPEAEAAEILQLLRSKLPAERGAPAWAMRKGVPGIARYAPDDPLLGEAASKLGFSSSIALPMSEGVRVTGVLMIYAPEANAFHAQELGLLVKLAENLGHGIGTLRSQRKRNEVKQALRESEALYRALFEKSSEGVFLHDLQGNILDVNQTAQEMFGYTLEELRLLHPAQLVHPDERGAIAAEFEAIVRNEFQAAEHRCLRKDGSEITVVTRGKLVTPNLIQGVMLDVTEKRQAESELQASEARYRAVVENQTEAICRFRTDGRFTFVNDVYCKVFGKSREELLQGGWQPVCLEEDLPRVEREVASLSPDNPVVMVENRVIDGEGRIIWMQFVNRGFFDEDGKLLEIQSVGRDITSQKQLQAEAIRSARLASLGELAAGVAHEVNNPLTGIINSAQLLVDEAKENSADPRFPELILAEGRRVAQIVRNLLSLAREDEGGAELQAPGDSLELALDLVRRQMEKSGVRVEVRAANQLPRIAVSKSRLQQVFLNLLRNAHQALNRRKDNQEPKRVTIRMDSLRQNGRLMVRYQLEDNGEGLLPEHLPRLFDPFYSTKPHGEGTGLGLSISRSIVEHFGGRLDLEPNQGAGATAVLLLPAMEGGA